MTTEDSPQDAVDHKEMPIWKSSREMVKDIYQITSNFPSSERYGLTMRMRRTAVGLVSNVAEAFGRQAKRARERSLDFARGAAFELETQLTLAQDLGFAYDVSAESESIAGVIEMLDDLIKEQHDNLEESS